MGKPLRVLIVEDSEDDAILLVHELRKGGYEPAFERVDTHQGMDQSLTRQKWDIVIADYVMPRFGGLAALQLLKAKGIDLPFIMVSGKVGEEVIVETMKAGAHDYILKDNPRRLVPAVERELGDAEVRRERRLFEEERNQLFDQLRAVNERLAVSSVRLKAAEELCRHQIQELDAIIGSIAEAVVVFGADGKAIRINSIAVDLLGLSSTELGRTFAELWARLRPETEDRKPFSVEDAPPMRALCGETVRGAVALVHRASVGKPVWVSISASPIPAENGKGNSAVAIFTEITPLRKPPGTPGLRA